MGTGMLGLVGWVCFCLYSIEALEMSASKTSRAKPPVALEMDLGWWREGVI